jgi:cytochrome c
MRKFMMALAAVAAALTGVHAQAADDLGKKTFEVCIACHSVKDCEKGTGLSLHKLIGRTAGTSEGFRYSGPMKRSGIVWDEKNLASFLRNPQEMVPGNRMSYSGMQDEAALKALLPYLKAATK